MASQKRFIRFLAGAGVLAAMLVTAGAGANASSQATTVPPNLVPPPGNVLIAKFAAKGVQVYRCANGSWVFVEPAANLIGSGPKPGVLTTIHFRGPSWESTDDGSLVEARVVASSPVPGSIPELLLQSTLNRGDGIFGKVTFIQRLNTSGGLAPVGVCTDGQTAGVGYRADYRFFAPTGQ